VITSTILWKFSRGLSWVSLLRGLCLQGPDCWFRHLFFVPYAPPCSVTQTINYNDVTVKAEKPRGAERAKTLCKDPLCMSRAFPSPQTRSLLGRLTSSGQTSPSVIKDGSGSGGKPRHDLSKENQGPTGSRMPLTTSASLSLSGESLLPKSREEPSARLRLGSVSCECCFVLRSHRRGPELFRVV
jgi:hypothetical protein